MNLEEKSKFVSYVLRHKPEDIGLDLDSSGWAEVDELIRKANEHGRPLCREDLHPLLHEADKKRFALSDDGKRIRAIHGHSVKHVDMGYTPQEPPDILYHGTATRFLDSINENGIRSVERQYVHVSATREKALEVGKRHGKAILLEINAKRLHAEGHPFYLSENGIWLTTDIPVGYFRQIER